MQKELTLIHPDIDQRSGAGEIAAVLKLLSRPGELPNIYRSIKGGVFEKFQMEFLSFLNELPSKPSAFFERVKRDRGPSPIPMHIADFASATGALFCALQTAGVAGGEVVTASFNYVGVVNAIMMAGAAPKFVDVDPRTFCMDPKLTAKAVGRNTRAIILTHLNRFADIEPFYDLFMKRGLDFPLIQDASLAIGSTLQGLRPGVINIGPNGVTVFSLTVSKILSGLGGAVAVSHDINTMNQMYEIAHQGVCARDPSVIGSFGANFKMSAINAVIVTEQFKRRNEIFARRRQILDLYKKTLAALVEKGKVKLQDIGSETVVTHLPVLLKRKRGCIASELAGRFKIQTGIWWAHHSQLIYRMLGGKKRTTLPNSEKLANHLIFLPFHTRLSDEDVHYICDALGKCL